MSATFMEMVTVVFPDPMYNTGQNIQLTVLNASVSVPNVQTSYITTLSSAASSAGTDVTGLLYTPDLDMKDPCYNASKPYVPDGVIRQGSLPNENWDLIAIAPWISPGCTLNYLAAARDDPRNGFIFFRPNVNDSGAPPGPDDPQWSLGDGGQWKNNNNKFPVYVVNGAVGYLLMATSAQYSGNITSVPFGHELAAAYGPTDYVRLYVDISLGYNSSLPPLWVFLLIVLAILAGVIAGSFGLMYYLQYKRRRTLRRRIINGDVNLEALGIQRLIVPQELLDKMPVFEYGTLDRRPLEQVAVSEKQPRTTPSTTNGDLTASADILGHARQRFQDHMNQLTCAICLDDFIVASESGAGSTVRQLPCHHIYHPECVDSFLRENSSLCPMCKSSALPAGYCPKLITNAMVRRERRVRRMRERVGDESQSRRRLRFPHRTRPQQSSAELDMATLPPSAPPPNSAGRREWARQRAIAMLGRGPNAVPEQTESTDRSGRWRKVFGGILPG